MTDFSHWYESLTDDERQRVEQLVRDCAYSLLSILVSTDAVIIGSDQVLEVLALDFANTVGWCAVALLAGRP